MTDTKVLTDKQVQNKLKTSYIWFGSSIHSKEGKAVNGKIFPPLIPFIGLFHVANDK